jgi:hypothetical protein
MHPSRTISVSINRPMKDVYDFACVPENFMQWASGLAAALHKEGDQWIADTPEGKARVRFSERNAYGVLDHRVTLPDAQELYMPLRVIANDEGSEVSLTLFRLAAMDDAAFERDAATVTKDLGVLKKILETESAGVRAARR